MLPSIALVASRSPHLLGNISTRETAFSPCACFRTCNVWPVDRSRILVLLSRKQTTTFLESHLFNAVKADISDSNGALSQTVECRLIICASSKRSELRAIWYRCKP